MTCSKRTISYRELRDETALFAGVLAANGIGRGDRVIIYMPMVPEAIVAIMACARIGEGDRAEGAFESALRVDPRHHRARFEYGVHLGSRGKFRLSAVQFRRITDEMPERRGGHLNLVRALVSANDFGGAIAACENGLRHHPGAGGSAVVADCTRLRWLRRMC